VTDPHQMPAAAFVVANAARWLEVKLGLDPARAQYTARTLTEIMWPYVLIDAHAHMADGLRDAGVVDVADVVDSMRHQVLTDLMRLPKEGQ
jgi:hypothetical protein